MLDGDDLAMLGCYEMLFSKNSKDFLSFDTWVGEIQGSYTVAVDSNIAWHDKPFFCAGNGFVFAEHEDGGWDRNRGFPRGRGRGRGRGFRGRGRGGFNAPHADTQQDGGYNYDAPPQGRGIFPRHFFLAVHDQYGYPSEFIFYHKKES